MAIDYAAVPTNPLLNSAFATLVLPSYRSHLESPLHSSVEQAHISDGAGGRISARQDGLARGAGPGRDGARPSVGLG